VQKSGKGTRADCKEAIHLIEGITAEALLADRGYDTNEIIAYAASAGMEVVIPPKKNRIFFTIKAIAKERTHEEGNDQKAYPVHLHCFKYFLALKLRFEW